ncbi:hypothetical protein [Bifidobacterium callitrichidarum]|nr:hypothetical protein [Bifidobacterium callitrichidarum]
MTNPVIQIPSSGHPWGTVLTLAEHTEDPTSWRLAGGLMVQAHAMMRGLSSRPTTDADFLVDVLTHKHAVREVRDALQNMGFQVTRGSLTGYTTRMVCGNSSVDLLVDNHLSPYLRSRALLSGHQMLGMPGSRRAVARSMIVDLRFERRTASVCMPDVLGALLMKAASWRETRQGDRSRHLLDAALLASLIDDPIEALLRLDNRSRSDRRNIRTLRDTLLLPDDDFAFRQLDAEHEENAKLVLEVLAQLLDMPRHAGRPEDYV